MEIKTQDENGKFAILFNGEIDEDVDFSGLQTSGHGDLIFDFDKVTIVNSMGLRSWVKWMRSIPQQTKLTYRKCRRIIVDQMNILQGFVRQGSEIESFYVPYYCESCSSQEEKLAMKHQDFTRGTVDHPEEIRIPKNLKCGKCGKDMEWDVIEAKYFRFLKHRP